MEALQPRDFGSPAILLGGPVDYDMYKNFRSQLDGAKKEGLVVTELSTLGGDPEVARMMGEDIRFHSENSKHCRFVFLGKAAIYSAGTTFMSFFSLENRYLTRGTRLMIHERKLDKQLHINGPLTTCVATVTAALHEIEASIAVQQLPSGAARPESSSGRIGPISLGAKQAGERSARKSACCVRRGGGWKRGMVEMV